MVSGDSLRWRGDDDATHSDASSSLLSELAASIAHEVNQPIASIVTNAHACLRWLTEEQPNVERARKAVERIVRDGSHARHVVQNIRSAAWKSFASLAAVDLNALITDALDLMDEALEQNGVTLEKDLRCFPAVVRVDPVRLQQVIVNLARNGIEAMAGEVGPPRVLRVSCRRDEQGGVLIAVSDSGSGFDASIVARMFEPYFTTKPTGTGLGLSICRSIVAGHGGQLWASPRKPRGSTFYITLPAQ